MATYILRIDNGLISEGQRCKDEPRFIYYKSKGIKCDVITQNKKKAKRFKQSEVEEGITVYTNDWQLIKL